MGLITERGLERLSFDKRLLKRCWTPFDLLLGKGKQKVSQEMRQDFLTKLVSQLVARRHELEVTSLTVDAKIGCAEHLTAKWECGMRSPSAFNLMCWAEALDCQWVLVPLPKKHKNKEK